MPYTPPSHPSPNSPASNSPDASRRSSMQTASRPSLPQSASYLNKHRRTPSVTFSDGSLSSLTPQGTSEDLPALAMEAQGGTNSPMLQPHMPWKNDVGMRNSITISPPESTSSDSGDEDTLEMASSKSKRLQDLRDAVGLISQSKTPSPPPKLQTTIDDDVCSQEVNPSSPGMRLSFSTSALTVLNSSYRPHHARSITESSILGIRSSEASNTVSEEENDEDMKKPHMVRKKSGELVRPALRASSRRRPSSMPGTPVFSKAVHFDSHLEHVRHFLQVDRPLAVSAGSSPTETYDNEAEYPFHKSQNQSIQKSPPFEWEILTPNFPHDDHSRKTLLVKVEKVWLSTDQKSMHGSVAVANLAYQKSITCRFTLDYWKTTSEVAADYSHEIRPRTTPMGHDRFNFCIKLSDTANLETKTLFFCVRYSVNGQDFWDNNSAANFQVDFRKKALPQNGKNNFLGAAFKSQNGLPRSNRRQSSCLRPRSVPSSLNEFGKDSRYNFDQPLHAYLGDPEPPALRLKSKSSNNIATDNISSGLSSPSGLAFANRYDFGASLTAAVQAAKDSMNKDNDDSDALYMKSNVRKPRSPPTTSESTPPVSMTPPKTQDGTDSPVSSLPSASYEELVNRYCFFGTKQANSLTKDGSISGQLDGSDGSLQVIRTKTDKKESLTKPIYLSRLETDYLGASPLSLALNVNNLILQDCLPPRNMAGTGLDLPLSSNLVEDVKSPLSTSSQISNLSSTDFTAKPSQHQLLPESLAWRPDKQNTPAIRG